MYEAPDPIFLPFIGLFIVGLVALCFLNRLLWRFDVYRWNVIKLGRFYILLDPYLTLGAAFLWSKYVAKDESKLRKAADKVVEFFTTKDVFESTFFSQDFC